MTTKNPLLSVDIGGARCKFGLVDGSGAVEGYREVPTEEVREGGVNRLLEELSPYRDQQPLSGLALAVPAMVDWEHNHVRSQCPDLPWIEDVQNKKRLQDKMSLPLLLVNDVEATLVGEWRWGELKGMNSGVVFSLGRSMGSALLWDGRPQQGRRGSIMELNNMSLDTYGDPSEEFPPGASNRWLSGKGLQARIAETGLDCTVEELFTLDRGQDLRTEFIDRLAHLLGNVILTLDPERLVLTGGLTNSSDVWLDDVKERMDDFVTEQFTGLPALTLGRLRGDEVIRGPAGFWFWQQED